MQAFRNIPITRYSDGVFSETSDNVVSERKLRIFAHDKEILTLLCTPTMVRELIIGFGLSEGFFGQGGYGGLQPSWCAERIEIVWRDEDIEAHLPVDVPETAATITSGCARGITFVSHDKLPVINDASKVGIKTIFELYREFQTKSRLFRTTGGVHIAALCDKNGIIVFAEDIGRHNAVDKVIGYAFLENIRTKDKMLLLSGRLSTEISVKGIKAEIPIIVSRSAPTDMALEIAKKSNVTLIGFLRGRRLNIYSQPERVREDL